MKAKIILSALFYFHFMALFSQSIKKPTINKDLLVYNEAATKSEIISANLLNIPNRFFETDSILSPTISIMNPEPRIENYFSNEFKEFKDSNSLIYESEGIDMIPSLPVPYKIEYGFDANKRDMTAPLDNSIACSDDNFIISITNSYIEYYQEETKRVIGLSELINFEMPSPCDPKVYFDPKTKKFILFIQRCDRAYNNSEIMLGFTKTSNPNDGWNFYKLSGNPLNKENHWFDYPKIGVTQDGLFISGNIFNGLSGFEQTVIYQIDQNLGFDGKQLKYRVWHDIKDMPTTLMPVSYAFNNDYGKGAFLIGTTWQKNANYIKLYDITSDIYDANSQMKFYKVNCTEYNFFAEAEQLNQKIDNGDIRIQDAIICNDKIYYVFTSGNPRNFSRINFNVLDIPSWTNKSLLIGDNLNYSYCYPSIHLLSDEGEYPNIIIQYNGTSNKSYPDIRCKTCDENLNCTQEIIVKTGESLITIHDRWGDYSGIAKNKKSKNQVWLSSSYGKNQKRQTYVAKIVSINNPTLPTDEYNKTQLSNTTSLDFELSKSSEITILLTTKDKTTTIYEGKAEKGENSFEMFTNDLEKGEYKIEVLKKASNKIISEAKFKL